MASVYTSSEFWSATASLRSTQTRAQPRLCSLIIAENQKRCVFYFPALVIWSRRENNSETLFVCVGVHVLYALMANKKYHACAHVWTCIAVTCASTAVSWKPAHLQFLQHLTPVIKRTRPSCQLFSRKFLARSSQFSQGKSATFYD